MNKKLITIVIVLAGLGILGFQFIGNSKNTAATVQSSTLLKLKQMFFRTKAPNDTVICLKDSNGDDIIKFSDPTEAMFKGVEDCVKMGGAPGMGMFAQDITNTLSLNAKESNLAATLKTTTSDTTKVSSNVSGSIKTNLESSNTSSLGVTNASQVNLIGVVKASPRLLTPAELGQVNVDRKKIGLDKKKYKRGEYECSAFSRDLEKTNPQKYTVTIALCKMTVKCSMQDGTKKKLIITGGHMFNDVHISKKEISYVEPQTGKSIDPDLDGNGKFNDAEIFNINGVQEQIGYLVDQHAPGCEYDVEVTSGPDCSLKSYEDTVAAYKDVGPKFFPTGFNPN